MKRHQNQLWALDNTAFTGKNGLYTIHKSSELGVSNHVALHEIFPLERGDGVVHTFDVLHGVDVDPNLNQSRILLIVWFSSSSTDLGEKVSLDEMIQGQKHGSHHPYWLWNPLWKYQANTVLKIQSSRLSCYLSEVLNSYGCFSTIVLYLKQMYYTHTYIYLYYFSIIQFILMRNHSLIRHDYFFLYYSLILLLYYLLHPTPLYSWKRWAHHLRPPLSEPLDTHLHPLSPHHYYSY